MVEENKIPDGWLEKELGDLYNEKPKSKIQVSGATNHGSYPFFTSGDKILIHDEYLIDGENLFLSTGGVANIKFYEGKCAYSTDTYAIYVNEETSAKYLYYFLLQKLYYINNNYFLGSGLKHLQKKDFKAHSLILPKDSAEQKKIAQILTTVDNAISHTEQLIAKYQRIKTGLMQDLITKGIDKDGNIRSEETHKFKDSPLGRIPVEWDCDKLSKGIKHISDYRGKTPPYQDNGIPVISAETVLNGKLKPFVKFVSEYTYSIWLTREIPQGGDIIFTMEAPVGEVAIFPKENRHLLTRRVIAISTDERILLSEFLYYQLLIFQQSGVWNPKIIGSTVPRILKPDVTKQRIKIPDPKEQQLILEVLRSQVEVIEKEKLKRNKLKDLKTGLMQDLLSGKKRVTHLLKEQLI